SASSNQTKLYGNGMTAGQFALQTGFGGAVLFGPGNSQAYMVLCGGRVIDVHALMAHLSVCGVGVTAGTRTGLGARAKVGIGARAKVGFGGSTTTQTSS